MKTGIYMIRNKVNDKKYIGQAVDIELRWKTHIRELNDNKHNNSHLQNAWNKYGSDNFEFTIICLCEEEELDDFEIDMIAHFDTYKNGYNLTLGGDGVRGYRYTDEQRARRSEALKEYHKDPEVKANLSEAWKGDKNPMKRTGVKKKHSEFMKEYYKESENRKKISEAMKGKPKSEEHKAKLSKKVYCVTNDTIYASTVEAGEKLGINRNGISWCCKGENILPEYPDGHHRKKGRFKDSPVYEFWFLDEWEALTEDKKLSCKKIKCGRNAVYCVTNNTIYASTVKAEEELLGKFTSGTVSWACQGKYRWGNGHVYKKLGLEFWYLSEYEEKFGKVAI